MHQVGDHQEPGRRRRPLALPRHRQELHQRVEGLELGPRAGVQLLARHEPAKLVDQAVGARVPVANGIGEQLAVLVQESEVHAPAVDAEAAQVGRSVPYPLADACEAALHLRQEALQHPAVVAVGVRRRLGEAVDDLELERLAPEAAEDDAPAARPEVDRDVRPLSAHTIPDPEEPAAAGRSSAFSAR